MTTTTVLPVVSQREYVGRHRPDTIHPVGGDYSPLRPADRHLPAAVDEPTVRINPAAVHAARTGQPAVAETALGGAREVLAELDAWFDAGCPIDNQPRW